MLKLMKVLSSKAWHAFWTMLAIREPPGSLWRLVLLLPFAAHLQIFVALMLPKPAGKR